MSRYKTRKRSNVNNLSPGPSASILPACPSLTSQEHPDVYSLQPADAKKLCHFCLRTSFVQTPPTGENIDAEMGLLYVQLTGEKLFCDDPLISDAWCSDCATQLREAVKTVTMFRQANTFWTDYLRVWSNRKYVDLSKEDMFKVEVDINPVKMETSEDVNDVVNKYKLPFEGIDNGQAAALTSSDSGDNAYEYNDEAADNYDPLDRNESALHSDSALNSAHILTKRKHRTSKTNSIPPSAEATNSKKNEGQICHICGIVYKYKMGRHMETAHSTLTCDICGRTFNHKWPLRRHFREDHGFQRYDCPVCDRANMPRSVWLRHQELHRPKKDYACDKCGNSYRTVLNLRQHFARVHLQAEVACAECGKLLQNSIRLRDHMIQHQPKSITCPETGCPRMFWLIKEMKEHCRTVHLKDRKYRCDVCGKAFLVNAQLKKHHSLGRCRGPGGNVSDLAGAGNKSVVAGSGSGGRQQPTLYANPVAYLPTDREQSQLLDGHENSMKVSAESNRNSHQTQDAKTSANQLNVAYIPDSF